MSNEEASDYTDQYKKQPRDVVAKNRLDRVKRLLPKPEPRTNKVDRGLAIVKSQHDCEHEFTDPDIGMPVCKKCDLFWDQLLFPDGMR